MGDKSEHTSMSPDLHRLMNYSSIPYHIFSWNLQRNPAPFAHKFSSQQHPNSSPASSVVPPNTHSHPRKQNQVSVPTGVIHCASRVAAATAVAPIERVHILMQCQNEMIKYGHLSSPYKGMKDCFLRTIKHDGVFSLWRGNSLNVILTMTHEVINPVLPPVWRTPVGMLNRLFLYPFHYARVRLATDVKAAQGSHFSMDSSLRSFSSYGVGNRKFKFSGVFDVFNKTLKSEGVIGLYRGFIPSCLGAAAPYLFAKWITSVSKQNKEKREWSGLEKIIPLVMAVVSFSVIRYPFLTVSRRMMMTSGEEIKYKGVVDAVSQIVQYEGVSSLYKGVTPYIISLSTTSVAYFYSSASALQWLK